MGAGVLVAEWFTNEAERLYSMFAEGDAGRERETLIAFLKRHGPCTSRELGRGLRQYRRDGKATMALYELQKDKLGEFRDRGGKGSGKPGQPTREFVLFGTGQ
jgi:predicted transcriptional regulator